MTDLCILISKSFSFKDIKIRTKQSKLTWSGHFVTSGISEFVEAFEGKRWVPYKANKHIASVDISTCNTKG